MSKNGKGDNIRLLAEAQPFEGGLPVRVLGQSPDNPLEYYFLTACGRITLLPSQQLQQAQIEGLYNGYVDWLLDSFPEFKEAKVKVKNDDGVDVMQVQKYVSGWKLKDTRQYFMQEAARMGVFKIQDRVRGPGVYGPDPKGSSGSDLIQHAGDAVFHGGEWRPAGHQYGKFVYPSSSPEPRPSETSESEAADGRDLLEFLESWNYAGEYTATVSGETAADLPAKLLLGWLGTSMVVGALKKWRPHLFLTGEAAVGKTTLINLLRGVLGGDDLCVTAQDPTASGIRQELNSYSRAMIVDECEQKYGSTKAEDIIELAKLSSSVYEGHGGGVFRGSPGGKSQVWHVRSSFLFSGINPPRFEAAEAGRVTMIEFRPQDQMKAMPQKELTEQLAGFTEKSPLFRARMINRFREYEESVAVLRTAIGNTGLSSRSQDQFGALLGAYWTLTQDGVIPPKAAADLAEGLEFSEVTEYTAENMPRECLDRLLMHPISLNAGRPGETVGEIIEVCLASTALKGDLDQLAHLGIKVLSLRGTRFSSPVLEQANVDARRDRHSPWVAFTTSPQNAFLLRVYKESHWNKGAWATQWKRLPGRRSLKRPLTFAGTQTKGIYLPAELFLNADDEMSDSARGYIGKSEE